MSYAESHVLLARSDLLRWSSAAAVVLALHALIAALLLRPLEVDDADAGAPVVMIELAPLSVAPPAQQNDVAPGPQQPEPEVQERAQQQARPDQTDRDAVRVPDVAPAANPMVTEQSSEPPTADQREIRQPRQHTPVPTAPQHAPAPAVRPAAPALGRVARPAAAAIASWQRSLVAHLERFKRYPPDAASARGVATLAFSLDRSGRVVSSRIARSSGSAPLDRETLA